MEVLASSVGSIGFKCSYLRRCWTEFEHEIGSGVGSGDSGGNIITLSSTFFITVFQNETMTIRPEYTIAHVVYCFSMSR